MLDIFTHIVWQDGVFALLDVKVGFYAEASYMSGSL
jgi:hypothetical protein